MLNPDFRDMLSAFIAEDVEFLVVGAYALAGHGLPRATGVELDAAWPNRFIAPVDGLQAPLLGIEELLQNKRATGREQDRADVARLEALRRTSKR